MALSRIVLILAALVAVSAAQRYFDSPSNNRHQLQLTGPKLQFQPRGRGGRGQQQPYKHPSNRQSRVYADPEEDLADDVAPPLDNNQLTGQSKPKYNSMYPLTPPSLKFRLGAISDMDQKSKDPESKDPNSKWMAILKEGNLYVQQNREDPSMSNVTMEWDEDKVHTLKSGLAYSGRGMELSTLNVFNGKLYSCDDRTGVIYELPMSDSMKIEPVPWAILADGNFTGTKGFKCEWGTVKDGDFWIGGHGITNLNKNGEPINKNPKFVKRVTPSGEVTHLDWSKNFDKMAEALGIHLPGYVVHEAAGWSDTLQKWIFMPRKVSKEKFDEVMDENAGSNVVLLADENFDDIQVTHIGALVPSHGFASFKFIPGTDNQMIVALKSLETQDMAETYIMAFDLQGNVLMEETKFADQKFEGVEFL
jgi:soluble calcium-activated nucleotidase 1